MEDATVPEQRADDALPVWIGEARWTTEQAAIFVAAMRGIERESARRWLTRNARSAMTGERQVGRDGQNLYWAVGVRRIAALGMATVEAAAEQDPLVTLLGD